MISKFFRAVQRLAAVLTGVFLHSILMGQGVVTNQLQNGGFENASGISPWSWGTSGGAVAAGVLEEGSGYSGQRSFKISNETPRASNVYGVLRQTLQGLKPETEYQLRLWVKGQNVSGAVLACGPGWEQRMQLPRGTFDWKYVVFEVKTSANPANFNVLILADATIGALWIDDIELVEVAEVIAVEGDYRNSLVRNGGFDAPGLAWWDWALVGSLEASGVLDPGVKRSGLRSFKITNSTRDIPNTYGRLRQLVDGLEPGKKYRLRLWVKGESVHRAVVAVGEGWRQRKSLPSRTYDWQEFTFDFTADKDKDFQLVIIADGVADALWIDDVEIIPLDAGGVTQAQISPAAIWNDLDRSLAFYPLVKARAEDLFLAETDGTNENLFPAITLKPNHPGVNDSGGGTVRMAYGEDGLYLVLSALGAHRGEIIGGEYMWRGDSVQLAIDLLPGIRADGGAAPWYEMGFSLLEDGSVSTHAWRTGQDPDFDYASIVAYGERSAEGYQLFVTIPWHVLKADGRHLPEVLGVNVVFNSEGEQGRRQVAEWTGGIAYEKNPNAFAWAVLQESQSPQATGSVRLQKRTFDRNEAVGGVFVQYAHEPLPAQSASLVGILPGADQVVVLGEGALPAIDAGNARSISFQSGKNSFNDEGSWELVVRQLQTGDVVAVADIERLNLQDRLAGLYESVSARYDALLESPLRQNDVFEAGLQVVGHFLARKTHQSRPGLLDQGQEWALLQLQEMQWVLDQIEALAANNAGPGAQSRIEWNGPVTIEDGQFVINAGQDDARPMFFNGYGHFGAVVKDMEFLYSTGARLIQQERGPSEIREDGSLGGGVASILATLARAQQAGVVVDLLLSPHYFPRWQLQRYPEIGLKSSDLKGFIRYNIDHPEAKVIVEQWLRTIVPLVKDAPALFSLCLSNEPTYVFSGKDEHSRDKWIEWLEARHTTVANLNTLYGTQWQSFDEVPVPRLAVQQGVGMQRAFYDWILFNQQNFANWHQWMAEIVKEMAPEVPLHVKVMPVVFDRAKLVDGVDPELIAEFTDIAGNDASSWLEPRDGYAFRWQRQQMWYDLLHSYRGQPVYNSENHFIPDGLTAVHIAPEHTRSIIWQGALHHQWATALWVWEQPDTPALAGSIWQRPANTFAAGKTMLDLERLAPELSALNKKTATVALLYSMPSVFWNPRYVEELTSAYTALVFMGEKVTFITERQLASGHRSPANEHIRCIIVPGATHVTDAAVLGLEAFVASGGVVIAVGDDALASDEYGRGRVLPGDFDIDYITANLSDEQLMHQLMAHFVQNALDAEEDAIVLQSPEGGIPWGVEFRTVRTDDGILVSMINMLGDTQAVRLGESGTGDDLINGGQINLDRIELPPMQPALIRVAL